MSAAKQHDYITTNPGERKYLCPDARNLKKKNTVLNQDNFETKRKDVLIDNAERSMNPTLKGKATLLTTPSTYAHEIAIYFRNKP